MGEWVEKGPFRVRVLHEARAEERSFREAASPERIVEIAWDEPSERRRGPHPLTIVSAVLFFIAFVGANGKRGITDDPALSAVVVWVLIISAMVAMGVGMSLQSTRMLRTQKKRKTTEVRIDPRGVRLTRGATEQTFPKARVGVATRDDDGRHQVVLMSEGDVLAVLHDTHHEVEVGWLVERLKEELAR